MSDKVFISGSRSIHKYDTRMTDTLHDLISQKATILVGDSDGVDKLVQAYCSMFKYFDVYVYCVNNKPRNLMCTNFNVVSVDSHGSGREYFAEKDKKMTEDCTRAVAFWDGNSRGTKDNIERVENLGKDVLTIICRP